ncbi:hypothetical protein PGT21_012332 [Puccinia graminis f. sp. tritici]|uniref:Uncharacterized protein n=1 Tax=Puccinia graminis f. sp. tritici TaxID=56615 RepID=A0A5B0NCX4_PUCGR|nr:hypothetical protein PGT21_012332 [Puccinia graminis f. sp. tritici]KAA1136000.1 hypothetical protein PGTUg99_020088 [Puccinia graminis f. sp. tritici]
MHAACFVPHLKPIVSRLFHAPVKKSCILVVPWGIYGHYGDAATAAKLTPIPEETVLLNDPDGDRTRDILRSFPDPGRCKAGILPLNYGADSGMRKAPIPTAAPSPMALLTPQSMCYAVVCKTLTDLSHRDLDRASAVEVTCTSHGWYFKHFGVPARLIKTVDLGSNNHPTRI